MDGPDLGRKLLNSGLYSGSRNVRKLDLKGATGNPYIDELILLLNLPLELLLPVSRQLGERAEPGRPALP